MALLYDLGSEVVIFGDEYLFIHHDHSFLLLVSPDFPDFLAVLGSLPEFLLNDCGFQVVLLFCFDFVYNILNLGCSSMVLSSTWLTVSVGFSKFEGFKRG